LVACSHSSGNAAQPTPARPATSVSDAPSDTSRPDLAPGHASVPSRIDAAGVSTPHGRATTPPASIPTDCSTDVTAALQAWIDGVPDGATMSLPAHACYRVEGTLKLAGRRDLLVDGHATTLEAKTQGRGGRIQIRSRSMLSIRNSRNVTVRDLVVRGANPHGGTSLAAYRPEFEAQHAFTLNGDDGVFLDRVSAFDVYGDFVYVGGGEGEPSRRITVARSNFARSGRQGISVTDADNVLIVGNDIGDVARSLFDLEPNRRSQRVRHIRIVANTTGPVRNYWLANKGSGVNIGDVVVTGNVMRSASGGLVFVFGPPIGKRGPFTFDSNVFRVSGDVTDEGTVGAFVFANAAGVTIRRNELHAPQGRQMPAVELRGTSNVVVSDNRFSGTAKTVIADADSHDVRTSS
jgi:hypothetical protein